MNCRFWLVPFALSCVALCVTPQRIAAQDCDNNGIADADELVLRDCNRNGVIDECDLSAQTSPDCNGNGLPDECDVFAPCAMEPSGFAGGDGTPGNPYLVCTPAQLDNVRNHLDAHFRQIADIDMLAFSIFPLAGASQGESFTGSYDGDGHEIRNLALAPLNGASGVGLFGKCGGSASLKNINLKGVTFLSNQGPYHFGALVGEFDSSGAITNCHIIDAEVGVANVSFINSRGVLIGLLSGDAFVQRCSARGVVAFGSTIGGLIGRISGNASISDCAADVIVGTSDAAGAGGLIGRLEAGTVARCYSVGHVNATPFAASGGLIGTLDGSTGSVTDCFWDIETSMASFSAAGTGLNTELMRMQTSYGPEWDFDSVWGIDDGLDYPQLRLPIAKSSTDDCNGNGIPDSCELLSGNAVDCNGNGLIDECDLVAPCMTEPSGFAGGDGSWAYPYQICSPEQLNRVREDLFASYLQTGPIDMTAWSDFIPIGPTEPFSGRFDGGGYSIVNLTIKPGSSSLFGYLRFSNIVDVHLINCEMRGGFYAGGLCNFVSDASITNCSAHGHVSGERFVGGLCGEVGNGTIIRRSASSGVVNALFQPVGSFVGGLVGSANASILDSYSTALVVDLNAPSNKKPVGSLFGRLNSNNTTRCYGAGPVVGTSSGGLTGTLAQPSNSYWDVITTHQSTSGPLPPEFSGGRTTAEMQMQATYEPEWDFEDVWTIDEGNDYPRLRPYRRFVLGTETDDNGNGLIDSCDVGGDLDGDGAVTVADIPLFVDVLLTSGNGRLTDLNRDYRTNGADVPLFLAALVGAP